MADYFQRSRQPDPIVLSRRRKMLALSLAALTMVALPAQAQTEPKPFSPEELDQMLAPIALYDDALLSQVLMAASYPLEIVEAARWSQANPNLKGDAAVTAVADKTWDVSVKSLVAFPSVLKQLNDHLDWTQKLGDALIGQQADVATSIQRLRAKASAAGTLKTGKEQTVTTQTQGSETTIAIQPTNPEVVYVPTYDPNTAYGQWSNPSYPPTSYPTGGALMSGLAWGVGIAAAGAMFSSWNWNSGGSGNYVNVNANRATNIDRNYNRANVGTGGRWQHDASHRKGVAYRDPAARQQYGQNRPGADQRQQFRGQTGQAARPGGAGGPGGAGRPWCVPVAPVAPVVPEVRAAPVARAVPVVLAAPAVQEARVALVASAAPVVPGMSSGRRVDGGGGGNGLSGVNRGQQVNRESQRGHAQQQRAAPQRSAAVGGGRPAGAVAAVAAGAVAVEDGDEQADP